MLVIDGTILLALAVETPQSGFAASLLVAGEALAAPQAALVEALEGARRLMKEGHIAQADFERLRDVPFLHQPPRLWREFRRVDDRRRQLHAGGGFSRLLAGATGFRRWWRRRRSRRGRGPGAFPRRRRRHRLAGHPHEGYLAPAQVEIARLPAGITPAFHLRLPGCRVRPPCRVFPRRGRQREAQHLLHLVKGHGDARGFLLAQEPGERRILVAHESSPVFAPA